MSKRVRAVARVFAVVVVALVSIVAPLVAEDAPPFDRFPQALGVMFGPVSGSGLHYHVWRGVHGIGITGGIIYQPIDAELLWEVDNTLDYNIGIAYHRRLFGDNFATGLAGSLYLVAGGGHRGYIPVIGETSRTEGAYQADLNFGVGVGVEIILLSHISLPAEFLYGGTFTPTRVGGTDWLRIGPTGQLGLRYRY